MQEYFESWTTEHSIPGREYDRPETAHYQSRSVTLATQGLVATSQPLAAQAGLDVLKAGGNAVDAAIAVNAMLGVVEPMSCGIGGDLFCLYWEASSKTLHGLNASGRSPATLNRQVFQERNLSQIPLSGPLSWSVPGCVDGWEMLRARFGRRPLAELLQPAIETAERGFPISEIIAGYWQKSREKLLAWEDSARTFLPEGKPLTEGALFRNPNLARSYQRIAEQGIEAFYRGEIAEEIVRFSQQAGGFFSREDFAEHTSEWVQPVSTNYRGYDVWQLPPNGQGLAVLQMLNLLEDSDLPSMGPKSADYLHLLIEAKKLAFADRAEYYADPAFEQLPVNELISKSYAADRRKLIDPGRAAQQVGAGNPLLDQADTVYLTVVDRDRNCCSLIQSIYFGFGSQVVPGSVGFPLQNRGALFALDDTHRNRLEPRKRPFNTIIPGFVTHQGQPWFCFGVMGGDMQPQGQTQILVNLIDFAMNVQQAGDAARVRHAGSATPTGLPMDSHGGTVVVESGIPAATVHELQRRGHRIGRAPGSFGGYQGILIDPETRVLHGATESRKDGAAVGF